MAKLSALILHSLIVLALLDHVIEGLSCSDDSACNSGVCVAPGLCACDTAFCGTFCNESNCPIDQCENGGRFLSFACVCTGSFGYDGLTCTNPGASLCSPPCLTDLSYCFAFPTENPTCHCILSREAECTPCDPNPCLNGGTCTVHVSGDYTCSCPTQYIGANCQTPC